MFRQKPVWTCIDPLMRESHRYNARDLAGWVRYSPRPVSVGTSEDWIDALDERIARVNIQGLSRPGVTARAAGTLGAPWQHLVSMCLDLGSAA